MSVLLRSFLRLILSQLFLCGNTLALGHSHLVEGKHERNHDQLTIVSGDRKFRTLDEWVRSEDFRGSGGRCGQGPPTEDDEKTSEQVYRRWTDGNPCYDKDKRQQNKFCADFRTIARRVQVHFHVIQSNDEKWGKLSEEKIQNSIDTLAAAFKPDFMFVFDMDRDVYRINKSEWYFLDTYDDATQTEMKKSLHKGDCSDLNIYSIRPSSGILGWATFPTWCKDAPVLDGVVILDETVPGGSATNYNYGHTLVHEVGHWLGLYHTFQGGCTGDGDQVDDTPPEASPAFGCPKGRDSCRGDDRPDPISNFMDYSYDLCMSEFTPKQVTRMLSHWDEFRDTDTNPTPPTPDTKPSTPPTKTPTASPTKTPTASPKRNPTAFPTSSPVKPPTTSPITVLETPRPTPGPASIACGKLNRNSNCVRNKRTCCIWGKGECRARTNCPDCSSRNKKKCLRHGCCFWSSNSCVNKSSCPEGDLS